jgi:triosephosphate isomerase
MYFSAAATRDWSLSVAAIAKSHPAVAGGAVELCVLPSFPVLQSTIAAFEDSTTVVGAQDLFWEDSGAFTGEVSGLMLRELGCRYVEVGHAERRDLFAETDGIIRAKLAAAVRSDLIPIVCVGETNRGPMRAAATECVRQLAAATEGLNTPCTLVVAYEPTWAIGAESAASAEHIIGVATELRNWLVADRRFLRSRVVYGGSAQSGTLRQIGGVVNGIFLGRFAHDPPALTSILDEVLAGMADRT